MSLRLNQRAVKDLVTLTIENLGEKSVALLSVEVELDKKRYRKQIQRHVSAGGNLEIEVETSSPVLEGVYALLTTVSYQNEEHIMSLVSAGRFTVGASSVQSNDCQIPPRILHGSGSLPVFHEPAGLLRLHVPDEISVSRKRSFFGGTLFSVLNTQDGVSAKHTIYAIQEGVDDRGRMFTALCEGILEAPRKFKKAAPFSRIGLALLAWGGLASCFCFARYTLSTATKRRALLSLSHWSFSVSLYSFSLIVFFYGGSLIDDLSASDFFLWIEHSFIDTYFLSSLKILLDWFYFDSSDYSLFSQYAVLPIFIYMLGAGFFVQYYLKYPHTEEDKYWHVILCCMSSLPLLRTIVMRLGKDDKPYCMRLAGQGGRSLLVKYFFAPLLISWTLQNVFYVYRLASTSSFSFKELNVYVVSTVILIDVFIFAVGYVTEFPQLGNEIKSVDKTILGWVSCLACYPPLNSLVFDAFDRELISSFGMNTPFFEVPALLAISILWILYLWATLSLGFKASNLTNRGIVSHGAYAYVRHPAYAAKLTLWILTCVFLGTMSVSLVVSFLVLYSLRMWTEERHLLQDPDYEEYKKKVPYAVIPRVF